MKAYWVKTFKEGWKGDACLYELASGYATKHGTPRLIHYVAVSAYEGETIVFAASESGEADPLDKLCRIDRQDHVVALKRLGYTLCDRPGYFGETEKKGQEPEPPTKKIKWREFI